MKINRYDISGCLAVMSVIMFIGFFYAYLILKQGFSIILLTSSYGLKETVLMMANVFAKDAILYCSILISGFIASLSAFVIIKRL
jgi:hypothetical protein